MISSTIAINQTKSTSNKASTQKVNPITYDKPVVVFDIDSVLAKSWKIDPFNQLAKEKELFGEEKEIYFLDILGCIHQVYIGTYALLRALKNRNVDIAFFSAGAMERNELFVEKLYTIAFQEEAKALLAQTSIYAREHCIVPQTLSSEEKKHFVPNLRLAEWSQLQKDLRTLLLNPKNTTVEDLIELHQLGQIKSNAPNVAKLLQNAILIEDHDNYMVKDQEYNLLYLHGIPSSFSRKDDYLNIDLTKEDMPIVDSNFKDFYHLFYLYYILDETLKHYEKQEIPFRDAMTTIQMAHNHKELFELERQTPLGIQLQKMFQYNTDVKLAWYIKGLHGLKTYWPTLDFLKT